MEREKSLVEYIEEELQKKRPVHEIREELINKGYPNVVIQNAIIQAEHKVRGKELGEGKRIEFGNIEHDILKSKHAPSHTHIPAKDSDLIEQAALEGKKRQKSQVWIVVVFLILFIWLGIAFSPYFFQIGNAADATRKEREMDFLGFCIDSYEPRGTLTFDDQDDLCTYGGELVFSGSTREEDIRLKCERLSFESQRKQDCRETLEKILAAYDERITS